MVIQLLVAIALSAAAEQRIQTVDFNNFEYPWLESYVPSTWHWLKKIPQSHIRLKEGPAILHPSNPHSAYIELQAVTYGDLDGDRQDEAVVDLLYNSGGPANWHYLYVFKSAKGTAQPIALLQSGSRASGGLLGTRIAEASLILDFADAGRRESDCCSRGVIRVRYRLQKGQFVEFGRRERDSIRFVSYPLPKSGPQTVDTRVRGQDVQVVYTDRNGAEKVLVPSGVNAEPNLSAG